MDRIKIKMAIENSDEIKHFKQQIAQGYLNKDRAAQIAERQTRDLIEKSEEAMIDKYMLHNLDSEMDIVRKQEGEKKMALLNQKAVLHDQMYEKKIKCDEARNEFLAEKGQVNDIVQKIVDEVIFFSLKFVRIKLKWKKML